MVDLLVRDRSWGQEGTETGVLFGRSGCSHLLTKRRMGTDVVAVNDGENDIGVESTYRQDGAGVVNADNHHDGQLTRSALHRMIQRFSESATLLVVWTSDCWWIEDLKQKDCCQQE